MIPLLDSGTGGASHHLGKEKVMKELEKERELGVMLAGGLKTYIVIEVVNAQGSLKSQVVGVDVSSGVETDGKQDPKIIE